MKTIYTILFLAVMLLTGCNTIYEYPDDTPIDNGNINVDITLTIKDVDFEPFSQTKVGERLHKEDYDLRYIFEIYPKDGTKGIESRIQREVIHRAVGETGEMNFKLKLNARKYTILFWVDYVGKGTTKDLYYDTESLLEVKIKRPYTGSHDIKDAFTQVKTLDLSPYREQKDVVIHERIELKRPLAKIELIATDIQKYIDSRRALSGAVAMPAKVVLTYLPSIGEQYNVLTQRPERYSDSETFVAAVSNFSDTECTIAFDYLFVNGESTNVAVRFDIYDQDDHLLNSVKNLLIPIRRNAHTVMRGEFLTKEFQGGDVGIDDGFDGEIIITIPD